MYVFPIRTLYDTVAKVGQSHTGGQRLENAPNFIQECSYTDS